jgi:hypothetical protein
MSAVVTEVVVTQPAPTIVVVSPNPTAGMSQAQADARYVRLNGFDAIEVVATLPSSPDPNTIYITTT